MQFSNFLEKFKAKSNGLSHNSDSRIHTAKEFRTLLERECARADRVGLHFALVNFDLSSSKGNGASSKHLINLLSKRMRITDELGWVDDKRIGLLLFDTRLEAACKFANSIRIDISPSIQPIEHKIHVYPADDQKPEKRNGKKPKQQIEASSWGASQMQQTILNWIKPDREGSDKSNSQLQFITLNSCIRAVRDIKQLCLRGIPSWKRSMDIMGALFGLAILSVVFLPVAILIKIVSPGPVFFKQQRIGYGGLPFMMWKFRTMKVNAKAGDHQKHLADLIKCGNNGEIACPAMVKLDNDPQIIPLGNFLRKTCIDELPQLINVLLGNMSLVGPRPPIPYEVDVYMRWHKDRFNTLPGMTGLWQVSGKNRLTFKEMVRLDIKYSKNLSFFSDIKILAMTPIAIMSSIKYAQSATPQQSWLGTS